MCRGLAGLAVGNLRDAQPHHVGIIIPARDRLHLQHLQPAGKALPDKHNRPAHRHQQGRHLQTVLQVPPGGAVVAQQQVKEGDNRQEQHLLVHREAKGRCRVRRTGVRLRGSVPGPHPSEHLLPMQAILLSGTEARRGQPPGGLRPHLRILPAGPRHLHRLHEEHILLQEFLRHPDLPAQEVEDQQPPLQEIRPRGLPLRIRA